MKKLSCLLLTVLLMITTSAQAERLTLGELTLELPTDWTERAVGTNAYLFCGQNADGTRLLSVKREGVTRANTPKRWKERCERHAAVTVDESANAVPYVLASEALADEGVVFRVGKLQLGRWVYSFLFTDLTDTDDLLARDVLDSVHPIEPITPS